MDTNQPSLQPTRSAPLAGELESFFTSYCSKLLNDAQRADGQDRMIELVAATDPVSADDASIMLASLSRFLVDVAPADRLPVDELLTEARVSTWANMRRDAGVNLGTLSNHVQRLNRLLRVRRGLPARMGVPQPERSELPVPLPTEEQDRLVAALTDAPPDVAAAYVAAVGANLIGAPAVGGSVAAGEQVGFVVRDERRNIIGVLEPLARPVAGVPVGEGSWRALRQVAARTGVDFDQDRAIATYAALALCESGTVSPFPGAMLIRRYRLSRRLIDNVRPHLTGSDPVEIARLLRGDPSPVRGAA